MSLLRSGAVLFMASMAGSLCNYLFQFYMGRSLSVEDYGAMNALFSVMIIAVIPTASIMLVVAKYVSTLNASGGDRAGAFYRSSLLRVSAFGAVLTIVVFAASGYLSGFLKLGDQYPILAIGAGLFFTFAATVNLGMLQGLKRFVVFGAAMGLIGGLKLVSGAVLVFLGFGLLGAVSGVSLASFFIFLLTSAALIKYLFEKGGEAGTEGVFMYSVPVFIATLAFAVLTNIDLIMAKHFLKPEDAGLYAAVSILGKTILYLPASLAQALFPMVSEDHALDRDSFGLLERGLLYTVVISLAGLAAFALFPDLLITILFGARFSGAAGLLKYYGAAMLFASVTCMLVTYNLARNRHAFLLPLGAACATLIPALWVFHSGPEEVVYVVTAINLPLALSVIWLAYREKRLMETAPALEGFAGKDRQRRLF